MNQDRRYRVQDFQEIRFYQMPKSLFGNTHYKGLDLGAKAMYSILRDRQDLSIRNGWMDEEGFIYSIYTIDDLAELLEMNRKTIMKYKKMLIEYGLLIAKSLGKGLPDRLYVLRPEEFPTGTSPKNGPVQKTDPELVQKTDPNDTDNINETEILIDCMKAREELACSSESIDSNLATEIYQNLEKHCSKKCYVANGVTMSRGYINEIYLMLINQFPTQLSSEVIELACDLYTDRATDLYGNMRMKIDSPIGFFNTCYKDAIKQYKATRYSRQRQCAPF